MLPPASGRSLAIEFRDLKQNMSEFSSVATSEQALALYFSTRQKNDHSPYSQLPPAGIRSICTVLLDKTKNAHLPF